VVVDKTIVNGDGYSLLDRNGFLGIRCNTCGMVSFNENDIKNFFCGKCGVFHEDEARRKALQDS